MIHLGNVDFMLKNGFMHNDEFGGLSKFDDYRPNYNKAMDTNFGLYLGGDSKQTSHDIHGLESTGLNFGINAAKDDLYNSNKYDSLGLKLNVADKTYNDYGGESGYTTGDVIISGSNFFNGNGKFNNYDTSKGTLH